MTSRLDRLLSLLESSPNNFLRSTAAQQLGELVKTYHGDLDDIFAKLDILIHHKNWVCRITASEVTSAIVRNLPLWTPNYSTNASQLTPEEFQSGYLTFKTLNLHVVLAQGAHLYSIDEREIVSKESAKFDRQSLNKFMGLDDASDSLVLKALDSHSSVNVDSLVSEDDFKMKQTDCEYRNDVKTSMERLYGNKSRSFKRSIPSPDTPADVKPRIKPLATFPQKWPLDTFCTRLLADLWALRWESRHGAASCLRELLSCSSQMLSAGMFDGLSKEQNLLLHSVYIEDIAVRVICTLALDKFSDFVSDEIVAPVRETAAQLLGILSRYLDQAQTEQLMNHLLQLTNLEYSGPGTSWMISHGALIGLKYILVARTDLWNIILWPIARNLLCRLGGIEEWPPSPDLLAENCESVAERLSNTVYHNPGAEDILAATVDAFLPIVSPVLEKLDSDYPESKTWLINCIWALLGKCSDLSGAISPILRLITEICATNPCLVISFSSEPNKQQLSASSIENFLLVVRLLHHSSSSIRNLAIDALNTIFSLLFNVPQGPGIVPVVLLHTVLDQLFHRVILECDSSVIKSLVRLWTMIIQRSSTDAIVQAALGRIDFWLCQAMQPSRVPFAPQMLNLLMSPGGLMAGSQPPLAGQAPAVSCDPPQMYIAGRDSLDAGERERELVVMETRITAVGLLAELCGRMAQSEQQIAVPLPNSESGSHGDEDKNGEQVQTVNLCAGTYIIQRVITNVHLSDRQANQRFLAGLFISRFIHWNADPSDHNIQWFEVLEHFISLRGRDSTPENAPLKQLLTKIPREKTDLYLRLAPYFQEMREKLQNCLTEVIYYEEILPSFVGMQDSARSLIRLLPDSKMTLEAEFSHINPSSVLNIVDCQRLLSNLEQKLSLLDLQVSRERELAEAFHRSKAALDDCLAVQLHLASRVELAMAAALVRCKYIMPGKMTLLIRPLIDTIRGSQPSVNKDLPEAECHATYPCTGMTDRLQRLAASTLTKLLWFEWNPHNVTTPTENTSKAAQKVVRNLVNYLVTSDPLLISCRDQEPENGPKKSQSNGKMADSEACRPATMQAIRFRGSCYTIVFLYRFFTEYGLSPFQLHVGLPALWKVMWVEWLSAVAAAYTGLNSELGKCVEMLTAGSAETSNVEFLIRLSRCLKDSQPTQALQHTQSNNHQPFLNGLCTNALCLPVLFLSSGQDTYKQLTAICVLRSGLISALIQPDDDSVETLKVRVAVGRLVLMLLEYASTTIIMNELTDWILIYLASPVDSFRLTAIIILNYLVANFLDNQFKQELTRLHSACRYSWTRYPEWDCGSTLMPGYPKDYSHADNLKVILPYSVILLAPVMRALSDHVPRIREYASLVFANLLVLMPLESSQANPDGMDPGLQEKRLLERKFIDCFLNPSMIEHYSLPVTINASLRPYQQDGINWLTFLNRFGLHGILCDDLGLGKTLQSICVLAADHKEKNTNQSQHRVVSLVVCPMTLTGHWLNEVQKFTGNSDQPLYGKIFQPNVCAKESTDSYLQGTDLVIASYENIRSNTEFFPSVHWNYLILDEGHMIKNAKTKLSMRLHALKARHRLILTGTPVQNYVGELWSLFKFLMPGFLGTEQNFNQKFAQPLQQMRDPKCTQSERTRGQQALDRLHKIILPFMLRRLKENVLDDLPPKIVQDYPCELTALQRKLYEAYVKQEDLNKEEEEKEEPSSRFGFEQMQYLLAICNHPSLVLTRQTPTGAKRQRSIQHPMLAWTQEQLQKRAFGPHTNNLESFRLSGKLLALRQLLIDCGFQASVEDNQESNVEAANDQDLFSQHRLLVFARSKRMLNLTESLLQSQFRSFTFLRLDGSVPVGQRFGICQRFNSDPSIDALLLTTSVGGVGLNLTGADTVIFLENDWNPSKDLQAMDRAHRIGQKRTVTVYRLVTSDTIEEQIMSLQKFKQGLANALVNTDNESLGSALSVSGASLMDNLVDNRNLEQKQTPTNLNLEDERLSQYEEEFNLDSFIDKLRHHPSNP
ncbi:btaf1 RNA polymerase II, B-TFIID transcription factor-associated, 170kDa [Cichlidogyrus casuarinus]|uniref:Btaf1 RNA polymerase II, B-TFIID transcription factor-associated, 170kDa n=1 Tax=Cichlidogyrus casuarinus TaxID=1844966 RepID=A0ABD2QIV5_9PLAT